MAIKIDNVGVNVFPRVEEVEAKAIRKLQHPVRARKLQGFVDGSVYREVRAGEPTLPATGA